MLRDFRPKDAPRYLEFLKAHFPEEDKILGTDPVAMERLVRRLFRWDVRILLAVARALRRPIARFFVIEVDHRVVATTLLTFTQRAGYVSGVAVDPPFRRRGFARRLLRRAHAESRDAGRAYALLDVLTENAPARALYASEGYLPLRSHTVFLRPIGPPATGADDAQPRSLRDFRREDAVALRAVAERTLPPRIAEVLPVDAGQFRLPPALLRALGSESRAWVLDDGSGPTAFLRATVSRAMASANLTAPVLGPAVPSPEAGALVRHALAWIAGRGAARVVTEVPDHLPAALELLERAGFSSAYRVDTLYHPLHA
ncbi:MAG: GNAT family N-acetyltransferase [Thermoplasmata archaeon]